MKTPIWESSPGITLATQFDRFRAFAEADLYTITCQSGPVLQYASSTRDVAYDPGTGQLYYSSKKVRVDSKDSKAVSHVKVGLDVDTWQVPMFPRIVDDISGKVTYPDKIGGIPFIEACHGGFLDGAEVQVDRAIFANWSFPPPVFETPVGVWRMFDGIVAEVDATDIGIILNINSLLDRLGMQMPKRLFQYGCPWTLFSTNCTLNKATFAVTGSVASIVDEIRFTSAIAAPAGSGTYVLGRIVMTSGKNAGFGRLVRAWASGEFTLAAPFYFDLAPGDTFTAYPGCDKRFTTCQAFANSANFGGDRFIPAPEVAV